MNWRHLRSGELDHEAIWLGVSLASLAIAWGWLQLAMPLPGCPFHDVTGCACPTCGTTRAVRWLLRGDFAAALRINPLASLAFLATAAYDAYAATVLALRLPRLRGDSWSVRAGQFCRFGAMAAILANWAWLWWRRV